MPKASSSGYLRVMSEIDVFLCDDTPGLRELTRHALRPIPPCAWFGERPNEKRAQRRMLRSSSRTWSCSTSPCPIATSAATIPLIRRLAPRRASCIFSSYPPNVMRFRSRRHRADLYVQKGEPIEQLRLAVLASVIAGRRRSDPRRLSPGAPGRADVSPP